MADNLETLDRIETKAQLSVSEAGEISGIAWPFSGPDKVGDTIEPGAFNLPSQLPICLEHDQSKAIGVWETITETDKGLEVKGRLFLEGISGAKSAHRYLKNGVIKGLSVAFNNALFRRLPSGGRQFVEVSLTEISLCQNPVHPDARISAVKSHPVNEETVMENAELAQKAETKTPANDAAQIDTKALNAVLSRLDKLEAKANRPGAPTIHLGNVEKATKAFADFIRTGDASELKALAVNAPSTGGILAPDSTSTTILEKVVEMSPVRQLATVIQMSGPSLKVPRLVDSVQPQIVSETGTKPDDEPSFEEITLEPFLAGVSVPMTLSLLEDSHVNLEAFVTGHIAKQFALKESQWFVNGDGTTAPEGVMSASAGIAEYDGTAAMVQPNDLISMFYELPQEHANNGAWLMHPQTIAAIRMLANTTGDYLWQDGLANGQPATLLGRPVYSSRDMPLMEADSTPVLFGDFGFGYTIADRVGLELIRDGITGAKTDIYRITARRRVGARVTMPSAFIKLRTAS
ncbi:MAG TPA: phage major capsid protein [Paracoccus sp. (in: a-proteobacteria)]|uniref:phage major capsid protein n=1 Tax=Paracoccus sp. TaxID=267 RepID=UPI002D0EFFFA|nr:phage major capsid protein [Paracoccus sp. (in: a-proteobacteria)]HWL56540.1 phage major capsid protein [Paracoccus sp. (in: a-proteobacteria)]